MQSFWCICIRISIIQLKVCKTDRIVYEDTTAAQVNRVQVCNMFGCGCYFVVECYGSV